MNLTFSVVAVQQFVVHKNRGTQPRLGPRTRDTRFLLIFSPCNFDGQETNVLTRHVVVFISAMLARHFISYNHLHIHNPLPGPSTSSFTSEETFFKTPESISIQFISERNTLLVDKDRNKLFLDNLTHHTGLFSPDAYVVFNHGQTVTHKRTRKVINISVYRQKLDDSSVILLSKTANYKIKHILVAMNANTTLFIPDKDQPGAFATILNDDYDFSGISDQLGSGEERNPPSRTLPPATASTWSPSGKGNKRKKCESSGLRQNSLNMQDLAAHNFQSAISRP